MKKNLFLGIIFLILMAFSASASFTADIAPATVNVADLDQSYTATLTLENTDTVESNYTDISFVVNANSELSSKISVESFSGKIGNGTSEDVTVTINAVGTDVTAGTYTETITTTYTDEETGSESTVSASFDAVIASKPEVSFSLDPASVTMEIGETDTFDVIVENTGNVNLTGLTVKDTLGLGITYSPTPSGIDVGETRTYTGTVPEQTASQEKTGLVGVDANEVAEATESFTVTVTEPVVIEPDVEFVSVPSFNLEAGKDYSKNITVHNPGTSPATGINVSASSISGFDIDASIDKTTIDADDTAEITLEISVPEDVDLSDDYVTTVTVTGDDDISSSRDITIRFESKLQFVDVEFETEFPRSEDDTDDDDGDLEDGDSIVVGEGSVVDIIGEVENIFDSSIEIENVKVYLEIDHMDGGSDYDERESIGDIDDGDEEPFSFTFTVPYDEFDDREEVSAILYAEGEDENGAMHYVELDFEIEIEKEDEEVTITEAYLSQDTVTCQDDITLYVVIKNTGNDDLDGRDSADLTVEVEGIGFEQAIRDIEMEEDDRDDSNEIMYTFDLDVSDLEPSSRTYPIEIIAYADGDRTDRKIITFNVDECRSVADDEETTDDEEETTDDETTDSVDQPSTGTNTGQTPGVPYTQYVNSDADTDSFRDSDGYLILLGVLSLLVIVLIVVLIVSLSSGKRR